MKGELAQNNLIVKLTFEFALSIMDYCLELEESRKFIIANQLLKSGTSIGANVREAQNAESQQDFIHKLKIAAKEADETEYWLLLIKAANSKHKNIYPDLSKLLTSLTSIIKILNKIISTMRTRLKN